MSEFIALISNLDLIGPLLSVAQALGLLSPTIKIVVYVAVFLEIFAWLFIAAMGVYRLHLNGKLKERTRNRWFTRMVVCYPLVVVAVVVDVIAQYTLAALFFWEWPPQGERLVSDRLERYLNTRLPGSWHWDWANTICTELDLFDPDGDHCNRKPAA